MANGNGIAARVMDFFVSEIWNADTAAMSPARRRVRGLARWVYLVIKGFFEDKCIIRASALTFTTMLSIVPFLAVAFSISKGLGLQNTTFIRDLLMSVSAGRAEVVQNILGYIEKTNVKTLGWMGVATLLVTVFFMVGNIEQAFNNIWRVAKGRSAWRKFTDFFSVILICPVIVLLATSFTVTIQKHELVRTLLAVSAIGWIEAALLKLTPYLLLWLAFTFVYAFMPNTKVRFLSAAIGGLVASVLWQAAQHAYISWQIGFRNYNAIYGSFAQLPLFLIWMYISWIIVLLGAEVSFAVQYVKSFTRQRFMRRAGLRERQKLAVLLMLETAQRFERGEAQATVEELAERLMVPEELLGDVYAALEAAGLAFQADDPERRFWLPGRSPATIRVTDVIRAISGVVRAGEVHDVSGRADFLADLFGGLDQAQDDSPVNLSLADFAGRFEDRVIPATAEADPPA